MIRKIFTSCIAIACLATVAKAQTTEMDINGLRVIFKHSDKYTVSAVMFYRGGTANYSQDKQGIEALALAATSECGTKKLDKDQFKDIADKYSISIGGGTSFDYGYVNLSCVKTYFNQGWDLFSQAILMPAFEEKELGLLQQKLKSNLQQEEGDPDTKLMLMARENAFPNSRNDYRPQGLPSTMGNFQQAEVKDYYYNTLLNKSRMLLVIVGSLDANALKQQLTATLGNLPQATVAALPKPAATSFNANNLKVENRSLATNYIVGVMGAPAIDNHKEYNAYRLAVDILSDKLFEEVRTKRNLSYAPYSFVSGNFAPYTGIYVTTTKPAEAVTVMTNEVKRLRNNGFTETELRDAKNGFATSYYMKNESNSAIAFALGTAEIKGSWKIEENLLNEINSLKLQDIQQAFNSYADGIRWNYLGDEKLADKAVFDKKVKVEAAPQRATSEVKKIMKN